MRAREIDRQLACEGRERFVAEAAPLAMRMRQRAQLEDALMKAGDRAQLGTPSPGVELLNATFELGARQLVEFTQRAWKFCGQRAQLGQLGRGRRTQP